MLRTWNCGHFGLQHKNGEKVVDFEFNLSELYDLYYMIPPNDGFRRDVQEAIDVIEKREHSTDDRPGLNIVVIEGR